MELEDKHDDPMEPIAASQPGQVSSGDAPLAKRPAIADVAVFHFAQELEP